MRLLHIRVSGVLNEAQIHSPLQILYQSQKPEDEKTNRLGAEVWSFAPEHHDN